MCTNSLARFLIVLSVAVVFTAAALIKTPPASSKLRYDNYKVFSLTIRNKFQLSLLEFVRNHTEKYHIWKEYNEIEQDVHIMVGPKELQLFKKVVKLFGCHVELLIPDVQRLINAEQESGIQDSLSFGWTRYQKLPEIEAWLDNILSRYPNVTEGFTIGHSYEGRPIRGIKISYKTGNPGIFIESNIHAREWITSATATWFVNQLLSSESAEERQLAESVDWYIIPVFNVDGFVYSHETDRLWRKTRQPIPDSVCVGTDANRNFNSHWMANGGASSQPCDETFAGIEPFSEPETKALSNFIRSIKDRINIYLAFHSYSQLLLSPYGHSATEVPSNYDHLLSMGGAYSAAVGNFTYGTKFKYGSTAKVLYVASGSSIDWVFNTQDVKVSYTIEFRDKGRFGFVLPPVQILPNCEELMVGMLALVNKSKELGYLSAKYNI